MKLFNSEPVIIGHDHKIRDNKLRVLAGRTDCAESAIKQSIK
jgi:hypothetical protein